VPKVHVINNGKIDLHLVTRRAEDLGDFYPVRHGVMEVIRQLWVAESRDAGRRLYWRQPLDVPTMGFTISFAAYVDREGNWHFNHNPLHRRLDRGTADTMYEDAKGGKAAAWIWPEIGWRLGDAAIKRAAMDTRFMLDVVDDDPLDVESWMRLRDAFEDDDSINPRDRKMFQLRTKQAVAAVRVLERHEADARKVIADREVERLAKLEAESYEERNAREERERRERGQRLDPAGHPEPGGVLT
jgi:hypothetical protein